MYGFTFLTFISIYMSFTFNNRMTLYSCGASILTPAEDTHRLGFATPYLPLDRHRVLRVGFYRVVLRGEVSLRSLPQWATL